MPAGSPRRRLFQAKMQFFQQQVPEPIRQLASRRPCCQTGPFRLSCFLAKRDYDMPMPDQHKDVAPRPVAFLHFRFHEQEFPELLSLSSLLYDIGLAHDLSVILSYERYVGTNLTPPYFYFRNRQRVAPEHQARAGRVLKNSPLFLEVALSAIGGIWLLVQIFDKVSTWRLNREKLKLEIRKLGYEADLKQLELADELFEKVGSYEAEPALERVVHRLERSEFHLTDLSIRGPHDRTRDLQ